MALAVVRWGLIKNSIDVKVINSFVSGWIGLDRLGAAHDPVSTLKCADA